MNRFGLIALAGILAAPVAAIPQCPGKSTGSPPKKERPANRGETTVDLFDPVVKFRHAKTTQGFLDVAWNYPRVDLPRGKPRPRPDALAAILDRRDRRPLLVLRECAYCKGTEQALLDARKNNDKTRLLCRWFHCVKLPPEVIDTDHALRRLFDAAKPSHLFLCDADGSGRQDFDGSQTPGQLHAAMVKMIRRRYEKNPLHAVSEMTGMLASFDKFDESLDLLRQRAQRETLKSTPDAKNQALLRDRIVATRAQRAAALARATRICDLSLLPLRGKVRRPPSGAVTPAATPARTATRRAEVDPYTGGAPAAMRAAGYVSFGPNAWSRAVDGQLPRAGIRWLETRHFVIGSSLQPVPMPKVSKSRRRLTGELKQLRNYLPTAPARPRILDPWLQLHLYALRLESLYDRMLSMVGAMQSSFPTKGTRLVYAPDYMGQGPHLGMQGKYRVLLLQKGSNLTRYYRALRGAGGTAPPHFHHVFGSADATMYAVSLDLERAASDPAHALRCQVLFHAAQDLIRGYRHFDFELPAWLNEGLANSCVRAYDPAFFSYSGISAGGDRTARNSNWASGCYRLVKNGQAPPARELCVVRDAATFDLNHHMCSWSRVEFLRRLDDGRKFAEFLTLIKAPLPRMTRRSAQFAAVLAAQEQALERALGMSLAEFDAAWAKHVLRAYRRR